LFYRLNVVPIHMPPLRERHEDIEALARHFLQLASVEGLPRRQLTAEAASLLSRQSWRGNVRELKNFIYRLALLAREEVIDVDSVAPLLHDDGRGELIQAEGGLDLDGAVRRWIADEQPRQGGIYDAALAAFERPLFSEILRETGGNQLRAAQALGINRNTLRKRLGELGLDPDNFARRP
jgi:two-component system nitrogen regulation response regulator GlnG